VPIRLHAENIQRTWGILQIYYIRIDHIDTNEEAYIFGNRLLDLRPFIDHSLSGMNISKITQILDERKKAADEAAKIQAVFDALDKICSEHGFESYAAFLKKVSLLEGGQNAGAEAVAAEGVEGAPRKKRAVVTAELVKQMADAYASRGDKSVASLAGKFEVSTGTLFKYVKNGFKFDPKPKGPKPPK
jgi:hypothetical protein